MVKFPGRGDCKISVRETILILKRASYEVKLERFREKSRRGVILSKFGILRQRKRNSKCVMFCALFKAF